MGIIFLQIDYHIDDQGKAEMLLTIKLPGALPNERMLHIIKELRKFFYKRGYAC